MAHVKIILVSIIGFILVSCSGDPTWSRGDMWTKAYEVDPTIELVPIIKQEQRILCSNYGPGCVPGSGKRIKIRMVELIVVEYESMEDAWNDAKRFNQYYTRNWLLDDVKNEPVLEDFVKKVFSAKNPPSDQAQLPEWED
jgi:hypothetical protein